MRKVTSFRHVAILLRRETAYDERVRRGIAQFAQQAGNWFVHTSQGLPEESALSMLRTWRPDGVLAYCGDRQTVRIVDQLGVPTIDLSEWPRLNAAGHIGIDHAEVGRIAARHFVDRGFRYFAYFGRSDPRCQQQYQGFSGVLEKGGCSVTRLKIEDLPPFTQANGWQAADVCLGQWLKALPKPVAIMLYDDIVAMWLLQPCSQVSLRVPEDVAVVGVNNYEGNCLFAHPAVSSVEVPALQVGYEAARMLQQRMEGRTLPKLQQVLPPLGVITRQSSDLVAINDEVVAAAICFIRQNPGRQLSVEELLDHLNVSRRLLERKFDTALGRSPAEEIRRVRLETAQHMLTHTTESIGAIAEQSGHRDIYHFSRMFKKHIGQTPGQYRKQFRPSNYSLGL